MHLPNGVFGRGTSPIDWCEGNYLISSVIAEFVNTISNVLFFVYPPLMTILFREYAECVNSGVYFIPGLLLVIGIGSTYFHATLSLFGQLLDEFAILWLIMAGFAIWLPERYFSYAFKKRETYQISVAIVCCSATMLSCIHPYLNSFVLMTLGVPVTAFLVMETRKCKNLRVKNLTYRFVWTWISALSCWISDRIFCELWLTLHFPYLHGAWHILIAIAAYSICVLFAYYDALERAPDQLPDIMFWPSDSFELGVPYVILQNAGKKHPKT